MQDTTVQHPESSKGSAGRWVKRILLSVLVVLLLVVAAVVGGLL